MKHIIPKLHTRENWCIEYTWYCDKSWYWKIKRKWKVFRVHRYIYQYYHPEIILNESRCVCHKCDNPKCCNIEHLFLWTHSDNMADMRNKWRARWKSNPQYWNNFRWIRIKIWELIFNSYTEAWKYFWISDNWIKKKFFWKIEIL